MPVLPDIHPDDRHIAPIIADESESILDPEPELGEPIENPDGSASFSIPDEAPTAPTQFQDNLAEKFSEETLSRFAADYIELIERDKESREKRDKQYEDGLRRTGLGDDAPGGATFAGASRVVHPSLAECCIDFEARAIKELFPATGPVKTRIWGKETEKKIELANRKAKYMNWQMTIQIPEYRTELEQILMQLAMGGSQYQKLWYDEKMRRARTEFIPIDDVFLPYSTTNFYTAQRVTHVQHVTEFEYQSRISSGFYRDLGTMAETGMFPDQTASAKANDKIEGKEQDAYNEDGIRDLYEIYTWYEFDEDDIAQGGIAPYVITIDAYTEDVLSIYRNWDQSDSLMRKLDWLVEWKFIPWRGAYGIGFPHIIGGLSAALTGSLRALLDSAHISNSATLVKLKGGKVSGQNLEVDPTQIAELEGPAGVDDIRKVIMPMPFNQPSPVLFQLLQWLTDAGKNVIATATEVMNNVGDRTPVGTTMAMVEQNSHTYSAIHMRLHGSQAKAIEILGRINKTFLDDQQSIDDLGEVIVSREDFANSLDICPVSDPNIFSEAQRFAQMQGVAQVKAQFPTLKWDDDALARRMLMRMRVEGIDEILPPVKKPQNMNPVAENIAACHGTPLIALPQQNHLAHLFSHLDFATSPIFSNPAFAMKMMPIILEHCTQHIGFHYADAMNQATNFNQTAESTPTKMMEESMAHAHDKVMARLQQELGPAMQKFAQVQEAAQAMAPKPIPDPAIEATLQAAMAEIQRKKDKDSAELSLKEKELLEIKPQLEQMNAAAEKQKNDADNTQKQITELLKNRDDNETNKIIEEMKLSQEALMAQMAKTQESQAIAPQAPGPDMGAMTNMLLQHILSGGTPIVDGQDTPEGGVGAMVQQNVMAQLANHSQQIADTIGQHMQAIHASNQQQHQALIDHLSKPPPPRQVIRGPDGKVLGVQ